MADWMTRGLFGIRGARDDYVRERAREDWAWQQQQVQAAEQAAEQQNRQRMQQEQARGLSDVLVANNVNPRQIPGIGGALAGPAGAAVAEGLMANPAVSPVAAQAQQQAATLRDRETQTFNAEIARKQADAAKAREQAFAAQRDNDLFDLDAAIIERDRIKAENLRDLRALQAQEMGVAIPEQGQAALTDPLTNQPKIAYLPGTPEYQASYTRLRGAINGMSLVNGIVRDINAAGTSGTDYIGTRAARVRENKSRLLSTIFQARGMGSPQGPDIELVEKGLPDTTSFMNNVQGAITMGAGGQKAAALQGYQGVQEEMQQHITDLILENPFLIDSLTEYDIGQLHPDSDLAKLLRQLKGG